MSVLLLGARGVVGRRILRLLEQALPDTEIICAGRRPITGATFRECDLRDVASFSTAIEGVRVVINAVGPFDYDPTPLVRACGENGTHWVDLAEIPTFIDHVAQGVEGAPIAAISGCSTVPALIHVLAPALPLSDCDEIRAYLSIGTNNPASATLLYSMLRPVGKRKADTGRWYRHSETIAHEGIGKRRYADYPGCVESGVQHNDTRVPTSFAFGFDRRLYSVGLQCASYLLPLVPDGLLRLQSRIGSWFAPLAGPFGTKIGILTLRGMRDGQEVSRIEVRAYRDGLDVPAWPSVWAAEKLLADDVPTGAVRLSDLISADDAITRLESAGFEVCRG